MTMECGDNITLWMVRWAAMLSSRYLVGRDGRTAHERRRGRRCRVKLACLGEKVWYKEFLEAKDKKNNFESDWKEGIWLGHHRSSEEILIGTDSGVARARTVIRQAEDCRWDADMIKNMKGTPQQPNPERPGLQIPIRINFDPVDNTEEGFQANH